MRHQTRHVEWNSSTWRSLAWKCRTRVGGSRWRGSTPYLPGGEKRGINTAATPRDGAREAGMMLFRGLPGIIQGPRIQGAAGRITLMQQQQQHVAHAPYTTYNDLETRAQNRPTTVSS